jgi:hypothetical protein
MVDGDEGRSMQGGERRCHAETGYLPVVPTWMTTLHVPAKRTENWHPVIVFHPQLSAFFNLSRHTKDLKSFHRRSLNPKSPTNPP